MSCWFHKWSKWKTAQYVSYGAVWQKSKPVEVTRNERVCEKCGLTQTRSI